MGHTPSRIKRWTIGSHRERERERGATDVKSLLQTKDDTRPCPSRGDGKLTLSHTNVKGSNDLLCPVDKKYTTLPYRERKKNHLVASARRPTNDPALNTRRTTDDYGPQRGRPTHALPLHMWEVTAPIYLPSFPAQSRW